MGETETRNGMGMTQQQLEELRHSCRERVHMSVMSARADESNAFDVELVFEDADGTEPFVRVGLSLWRDLDCLPLELLPSADPSDKQWEALVTPLWRRWHSVPTDAPLVMIGETYQTYLDWRASLQTDTGMVPDVPLDAAAPLYELLSGDATDVLDACDGFDERCREIQDSWKAYLEENPIPWNDEDGKKSAQG